MNVTNLSVMYNKNTHYTTQAAKAPTQDRAASSDVMIPTSSKAAPTGAPTTTKPSVSTDVPLGAPSQDTIEMSALKKVISEGPSEPTWTLVPPGKKPKNRRTKRLQQAKAEAQAQRPARQKVADGGPRPQSGVEPLAQVSGTSGQAERTQAQASHHATPATSESNRPRPQSKARGKRAGRLAKQKTTPPSQVTTGKRTRPDDTTTPTGDGKRVRAGSSQTRVSYAAAFKANELCVAVMTEPIYDLTAEQANGIKTCLEKQLVVDLLNPATADHMANVGFRGKAHFGNGVLKMWCESDVALGWLRCAVKNIASPIAGSTLVVRPQSEIQRRILCGLLVPQLDMEIDTIRQLLTAHNSKSVNIRSWSLVKAEKQTETETPGVYLLLRIPESDVDKLKRNERRLNWMFGSIYVRILEEDPGTSSARATAQTPAQPKPTSHPPAKAGETQPERQPEGMDTNIEPPSTPGPDEERFLDVEGSEASDSCLNSSPLRAS